MSVKCSRDLKHAHRSKQHVNALKNTFLLHLSSEIELLRAAAAVGMVSFKYIRNRRVFSLYDVSILIFYIIIRDFGKNGGPQLWEALSPISDKAIGCFGLFYMLRELVRPMRMFLGFYGTSQTSQKKIYQNAENQRIYETNFLIFLYHS